MSLVLYRMIQVLGALCSVSSFGAAIWAHSSDYPRWEYLLLYALFLLSIGIFVGSRLHWGRLLSLSRVERVAFWPCELEVFYERSFDNVPHLSVQFTDPMASEVGCPAPVGYRIAEQRSDGFRILVFRAYSRRSELVLKWRARGMVGGKKKKETREPWLG